MTTTTTTAKSNSNIKRIYLKGGLLTFGTSNRNPTVAPSAGPTMSAPTPSPSAEETTLPSAIGWHRLPVENYFESRYYIELQKAHNLFEWLVSRDTEAGQRSY
jgi:hypothetical protein